MRRSFYSGTIVLALAGLVLAGCAVADKSADGVAPGELRGATRLVRGAGGPRGSSVGSPADAEAFARSRGDADDDDAEMERRVQAFAHFGAGISQELNDQPDKALDHFAQSALADPSNESLILQVVRRYVEEKKPAKALELLVAGTALPTASGALFSWLGYVNSQLGKTEAAAAADRIAIKKSPGSLMAYQNLAQIYLQKKQPKEALTVLDDAARQPAPDAGYLFELAEIYANFRQLQPDQADAVKPRSLELLDRAAKLRPQNVLLLEKMADGYRVAGELAKSEGIYLQLLERFPNMPMIREKLTEVYLRRGKQELAAQQMQAIARDNPNNPQAYFFLGSIAYDQTNYVDAAGYFEKVLALNPAFEPVYYELAELRVALNKPDEALDVLKKAREKFKENFLLEFHTAFALAKLKRYDDAIKAYAAAEAVAKTNEPERLNQVFYFQLGAAYERKGDFAQAEKIFHKCLGIAPDFADALNYLGYMWADRGVNLPEARKLIEKANKLEPGNAAFLDSLGWVLYKLKQPREALPYLLEAVKVEKDPDATLYDHLGDIQAALKQFEQAHDAWQKSVELEANDEVSKKLKAMPAPNKSGK